MRTASAKEIYIQISAGIYKVDSYHPISELLFQNAVIQSQERKQNQAIVHPSFYNINSAVEKRCDGKC